MAPDFIHQALVTSNQIGRTFKIASVLREKKMNEKWEAEGDSPNDKKFNSQKECQ